MKTSWIATFEGIDGSGKSSVAEAIARLNDGLVVTFPNDEAALTGPIIRQYLRGEWEVDSRGDRYEREVGPLAFQALQLYNRAQTLPRIMSNSRIVLARGWQSGAVYGQLDGLPRDVAEASRHVFELIARPQLHVLLSVDVSTAYARREQRDGAKPPERYEGNIAKLSAVSAMYHGMWERERARQLPNQRWEVVDANAPLEEVVFTVKKLFNDFIYGTFG